MPSREIELLIQLLAKLPGLGPRSARRATLHLIKRREALMQPLSAALTQVGDAIVVCTNCGNLDAQNPCGVCQDQRRNQSLICVVEDVADLWALERAGAYKGQYHVLGGVLSALDGVGPEDLNVADLIARASTERVQEIVLAMNATVDGQTTAHYLAERLEQANVAVSRLAHGVPVGGELDYLDDGTLAAAMKSRRPL
jgi:recombination protein RecR